MTKVEFQVRAKQREQIRSYERSLKYAQRKAADDMYDYDLVPLSPSSKRKAVARSASSSALTSQDDLSLSPPASPFKGTPSTSLAQEKKRNRSPRSGRGDGATGGTSVCRSPVKKPDPMGMNMGMNMGLGLGLGGQAFSKPAASPFEVTESNRDVAPLSLLSVCVKVLEDKVIGQVYAALYRHTRVRSVSVFEPDDSVYLPDLSQQHSGEEEEDVGEAEGVPLPVEFSWFRRLLRPSVARHRHRHIAHTLMSANHLRNVRSDCTLGLGPPLQQLAPARSGAAVAVPSFEMFCMSATPNAPITPNALPPPLAAPPPDDGPSLLSEYLDASFVTEMVSQLFVQDHRLYSATLDLAKAVFSAGDAAMQTLLADTLHCFTSDRVRSCASNERRVLEFELVDVGGGHDCNAMELVDHMLARIAATHCERSEVEERLLVSLSRTLLNVLASNHSALCVERGRGLAVSTGAVLRSLHALLAAARKKHCATGVQFALGRSLVLSWPAQAELGRAYVAVAEAVLQSVEDPLLYLSLSRAPVRLLGGVRVPAPSSALSKCVDRAIDGVSSLNAKLSAACIAALRRNNILHGWVLPLAGTRVSSGLSGSEEGLADEQTHRERRLERMVDTLRLNRGSHWSAEVKEACGAFLDDLLDHLTSY